MTLSDPSSYMRQIAPAGNLENPLWWLGTDRPPPRLRDSGLQRWLGSEALEQLARISQERIAAVYEQIAAGADKPARPLLRREALAAHGRARRGAVSAGREVFLVRDFRDMVASIMYFNRRRGVEGFGRAEAAGRQEWVEGLAGWATTLVRAWGAAGTGRTWSATRTSSRARSRPSRRCWTTSRSTPPPPGCDEMQAALATEMPELARHRTRSASESVGRWRADLPDDLQEACATAFREALATFGYEP